jgi:hypothetical protein
VVRPDPWGGVRAGGRRAGATTDPCARLRRAVLLPLVAWGCAPARPAAPVPAAPVPAAPVPVVSAPATALPPLPPAVIPVQVTYVLRAMHPVLDSLFPARDSLTRAACEAVGGAVCHQYVYRRDPLRVRGSGDSLFIDTRLAYRAQVRLPVGGRLASCGYAPEAMRRASVAMRTALYWRRDWRIGVRGLRFVAGLEDPCKVTALGLDATPLLQQVVDGQMTVFAAQADSLIPQVADFRPLADSLWRSFLAPTAMDSTGALWLLMEPEGVRVTPFAGTGPAITTTLTLTARPRIVAGARPASRAWALPTLTLGAATGDFRVPVEVVLPYAEVERQATALLAAETAGASVVVERVAVRGTGDTAVIALGVRGALRGELTLAAVPRWDAGSRTLLLEGLDWSLQSRGLLSRVTSTLAAPLVARAVRQATGGGRIPLGAQLDTVRAELLRTLNAPLAPGVVMGSSVQPVQVEGIWAGPTSFVVRAAVVGRAGVWVQ